uniref:Uncharacterized protein n=1 Tax=Rhizophora mucronata TaxID=61149 RepID=A0A2P2P3V5_RHIMU
MCNELGSLFFALLCQGPLFFATQRLASSLASQILSTLLIYDLPF